MPSLRVNSTSESVDLYYEDQGAGPPVVLVHGSPLASECFEKQVPALLDAGYRTVYYDRRGFGRSSRPGSGYDYDTPAADLDVLITTLDLREIALVGFSMGTGECARYLARYGTARVRAVAFLASIPHVLLETPDNPAGVDQAWFDRMTDLLGRDRVSDDVVRASANLVASASGKALEDSVSAWMTDFRAGLVRVDVPALVLHGDDDCIAPIAATGLRLHQSLPRSRWVVIEGGTHGLTWTHAEEVNRELLAFFATHMKKTVR